MKKLLLPLLSIAMLFVTNSCEKISEANIVGRWEMQKIEAGGETITEDRQVWEFAADHKLYVQPDGDENAEYAGNWVLVGNKLTVQFVPVPVTVKRLSSSTLVLEATVQGQLAFRYTFSRLK